MLFFQYVGIAEQMLVKNDWELFREMCGPQEPRHVVDSYIKALAQPGCLTAALNWYRANFRPEMFSETLYADLPLVTMPVMGIWSTRDAALTEEQMKSSARCRSCAHS